MWPAGHQLNSPGIQPAFLTLFPPLVFMHVLFSFVLSALFLPEEVCMCTRFCMCTQTETWFLLTHVYCHHQEVALLNSSAELNFSLKTKTSPWERKTQKQSLNKLNHFHLACRTEHFCDGPKTVTKQDTDVFLFNISLTFPPEIRLILSVRKLHLILVTAESFLLLSKP